MPPKYHPTPLSGGDRKALRKELVRARAMTGILAEQSNKCRSEGEALIREADNLACQSWNERMWSDGGPAQPPPTIEQAINGGYPWLEVQCSRCQTMSSIDLVILRRPPDSFIHQLEGALRCRKCSRAKWIPRGNLHQLASMQSHTPPED